MIPRTQLSELDLLDVGNSIQLAGAIYVGNGKTFLIPLPDENPDEIDGSFDADLAEMLVMTDHEMERFLNQTDVLDVQSKSHPRKAILRKSQRQIDQIISWRVYKRDGYACRYCGRDDVPLTVDHVDLWENGGATIEANLVTACRRCNKSRGNMDYEEWMASREYAKVSLSLTPEQLQRNAALIGRLAELRNFRIKKRSR